jgi:hypothetical protein
MTGVTTIQRLPCAHHRGSRTPASMEGYALLTTGRLVFSAYAASILFSALM